MSFLQAGSNPAIRRIRNTSAQTILPALILALFATATTGYAFTALYSFGDSLTDTGRNPAPSPSYFNGRYSNGSVWVEYLSTLLGLPYNTSNNLAVSGSTTSDLQSQIAGLPTGPALQSGLFTILSGGNDFLNTLGTGTNDATWNAVVTNAVVNLTNAVGTLFTKGAREILIGNLPDLGKIPELLVAPPGYSPYVSSKVTVFNALLATATTNLMQHYSGLRIYLVDNNTFLNGILSAPAAHGFTVTTIGALEDFSLSDKSFTGPGASYVFWDIIHPTTKMHALIGALAFQNVGVQLNLTPAGANLNLNVVNLRPGLPYTIQRSTNLTAWSNYGAFTAAATNATLTVTNSSAPKAFYRVGY